jgi:hypothetical protein
VDDLRIKDELQKRMDDTPSMVDQVIGAVAGDVKTLVKSAILGNIYTFSLTKLGTDVDMLARGNIIGAAQTGRDYVNTIKEMSAMKNKKSPEGNIYGSVEELIKEKPSSDIYPNDVPKRGKPSSDIYPNDMPKLRKPSGNIFHKSSIANN